MDPERADLQGNDQREMNMHRVDGHAYSFSFAFKQQLMRAWQPVPTLCCAIIMFGLFGLIFLFIGFGLLLRSQSLYESTYRYDTECDNAGTPGGGQKITISVDITEEVTENVFFYYEIKNFYQNHRRYFKSKSSEQLRGNELSKSNVETDCDPVVTNADLWTTVSVTGQTLDPAGVAYPCGMMARSIFNDSFVMNKVDATTRATVSAVELSSEGIAWPEDKLYKYKNLPSGKIGSVQWYDISDERFMVWMRAAATPNFRKLWARIKTLPLQKGAYQVEVTCNWSVKEFEGEKYFVIAQTNAFGGKNTFLSICYLIVGGICLLAAALFTIRKFLRPNGILEAKLK